MSKENLDQFIQKVTDSEELQARIGEDIDIDSLIALGAEHGCEFSAEDLAAGVELSDEELDSVAGGFGVDSIPGGLGVDDILGKPLTYIEQSPGSAYSHIYQITGSRR